MAENLPAARHILRVSIYEKFIEELWELNYDVASYRDVELLAVGDVYQNIMALTTALNQRRGERTADEIPIPRTAATRGPALPPRAKVGI